MAVSINAGRIALTGICGVEDAETLRAALADGERASLDLGDCEHLHAAVLQVLMAARTGVAVPPREEFLLRWIVPALQSSG